MSAQHVIAPELRKGHSVGDVGGAATSGSHGLSGGLPKASGQALLISGSSRLSAVWLEKVQKSCAARQHATLSKKGRQSPN